MFIMILELTDEELRKFQDMITIAVRMADPPFEREFIMKLDEAVHEAKNG